MGYLPLFIYTQMILRYSIKNEHKNAAVFFIFLLTKICQFGCMIRNLNTNTKTTRTKYEKRYEKTKLPFPIKLTWEWFYHHKTNIWFQCLIQGQLPIKSYEEITFCCVLRKVMYQEINSVSELFDISRNDDILEKNKSFLCIEMFRSCWKFLWMYWWAFCDNECQHRRELLLKENSLFIFY